MPKSAIHCPFCNAQKAIGLGLVVFEQSPLVQYRCGGCNELFFLTDQREQKLTQISEQKAQQLDESHNKLSDP